MAVLVAAAVGCTEDGAAPAATEFPASQAEADFTAVNDVFESGIWEAFGFLGEAFPLGAPGASAALAVEDAARAVAGQSPEETREVARQLAIELTQLSPRIPLEIRGITFVLDPETLRYVASDREGAPENGVRFILYAVNPVTRKPLPDVEIGYADLMDLGDDLESGVSLRWVVVSGDVTYFDYTVTATGTEGSRALTVEGFVSNGATTMEFEIEVAAERSDAAGVTEVAFVIAIPERGFRAAATVRHAKTAGGHTSTLNMEIHVGDHVIVFAAEHENDEVSAEVHLDGELFATITGRGDNVVITGPGGRELTEQERRVLRHIMQLQDHVFRMFNHLMKPVNRILSVRMLP